MSPNENSLLKIKLNLCEIHKRKAGDGERNPTYKVLSLFCSWHKLLDMLLIFVPVKVLWENIVCLRNDSSWDGKQNAVLTEKSTHSHICIWTRVHVSHCLSSVQFSSVAQSCPTLCDPMKRSTPGLPVHHQLPEFTQTHVHGVSDTIQPSHPLTTP